MSQIRDHAESFDVAIVGAGPAGLGAAQVAASYGLSVAILDEQPEPGGQIYRCVTRASDHRHRVVGNDYATGLDLANVIQSPGVSFISEATVFEVTPDATVLYSRGGSAAAINARHLILACGATERPCPFPGWELPGVMTAGAGQILLKASGILPGGPTVLAGSGPLLFLLAAQYQRAGRSISALIETTPADNRKRALGFLPGALRGHGVLRKGLGLLRELKRSGVAHVTGASELNATGNLKVQTLEYTADGRRERVDCSTLLVHQGVIPNVQFSRALGIDHTFDPIQRCWNPVLGDHGETPISTISIVGDGAGIAGAQAAAGRGRVAAVHAAHLLGAIDTAQFASASQRERRSLSQHLHARRFIDALYAPAREFLNPVDDTIVCRCEEVRAGQIREHVLAGCLGPNQTKAYSRCGMGPCQGRFCGLTVAEVIADARKTNVDDVGYYRIRFPVKPVTVGELAALSPEPD